MPPGYVQIAGGYYMIKSGSCGSGSALIMTVSECEAAATALDLSDKTAVDYTSYTFSNSQRGCVFEASRSLYVYGFRNYASCSSYSQCICKSTSP